MLTPIELQGKSFKSGIGYDRKDVEHFFKEVYDSYEMLYKENIELKDKITVLNEGIQYYKTIEKTLQKALVLAEKTAQETTDAADKKAESIEQEARMNAKKIVDDARIELEQMQVRQEELVRRYEQYKLQIKKITEMQLELLEGECFQVKMENTKLVSPLQLEKEPNIQVSLTEEELDCLSNANLAQENCVDENIDASKNKEEEKDEVNFQFIHCVDS